MINRVGYGIKTYMGFDYGKKSTVGVRFLHFTIDHCGSPSLDWYVTP